MRLAENTLNDFRLIEVIHPPAARPMSRFRDPPCSDRARRLTPGHTLERYQQSLAWLRAELARGEPDRPSW